MSKGIHKTGNKTMRTILYVIASLAMPTITFAQPGALDNTFGTSGKFITSFWSFGDQVNAVAIQGDGKIVLGGYSYLFILEL